MNILSQSAFWTVNKDLAKDIGIESALLLSDLIRKEEYFAERGELTEDGFFYNTIEDIEKDTTLSNYQQKKCIDILKKEGYMETDLRGMPAKLHFKIIQSKILSFLNHSFEKTSKQVFKKFETNKNKYNKNKEQDIYSTNVEYNSTSKNLEIIEEGKEEYTEDDYVLKELHEGEKMIENTRKMILGNQYKPPMRLKTPEERQRDLEKKKQEQNFPIIIKEKQENKQKDDYKKQESSAELREKVLEFLEYRKDIKKPLKEASQKAFQKNLEKLSGGDEKVAIEILDQSIANGWQGIFELKTGNKVKGGLRVV